MIGRALRAQARSAAGDVVLLGVTLAAFLLSLSLATSIPAELAAAPPAARAELVAPFDTVLATYAGILAAVYGSFRYTIDRRDGVVAQRLMLESRGAMLAVRMPATALGGAVVAVAAVVGGRTALLVTMGGLPVQASAMAAAVALGAVAALWGMGIGIVVPSHLAALFVAALSMGMGLFVAMFWSTGAVYLPLPALLEAFQFDVSAVGIAADERLGALAVPVTAGWSFLAAAMGAVVFLRRDVT
ncbi:hypothetical protein [Zhihengliuella sp. ISTPL4]|uniref:hypothetical protein n=1 Tax=Zhihengliuella sp. ISTPL4 TaxID=2058657 RepID=UPI000C7E306D|nr:hypothetical protein [Zhihengliuella sp. ISTPL4]